MGVTEKRETPLTAAMLATDPSLLTREATTAGGLDFTGRLLRPGDAAALGRFFDELSDEIRDLYCPHPLNSEYAGKLCSLIDYAVSLRFVAEIGSQIQGYFILDLGVRDSDIARYLEHGHGLEPRESCTFAPSVADACLSSGIGSALMPLILEATRRLGRRRLILMGGVRADNPRAQHFYRKFGFEQVGEFFAGGIDNLDMMLTLPLN